MKEGEEEERRRGKSRMMGYSRKRKRSTKEEEIQGESEAALNDGKMDTHGQIESKYIVTI